MSKIATLDVNQIIAKNVVFWANLKKVLGVLSPQKLKFQNSFILHMIDIFNTLLERYRV